MNFEPKISRRSARLHEQDAFARETERQRELDQDIARLSPFFQRMLPGPGTSTPRSQRNRDRLMRAPRSEPSPIERERNQYIRHVFRTETLRRSPRRLMVPPVTPVRRRVSFIVFSNKNLQFQKLNLCSDILNVIVTRATIARLNLP